MAGRRRPGVGALALLILTTALNTAAASRSLQQKPPPEVIKKYGFPAGVPLSQLPGAQILNPGKVIKDNIAITLAPVVFQGPTNAPQLFSFTTMAYYDDSTNVANVFGPTMRVKRGSPYIIKVTNALVQPTQAEEVDWIHNPGNTNMHTHGIHAELGVPSQSTATTYLYGDNPFFKIQARSSTLQPPAFKIFNLKLPTNHLPGLHWYHPHQHGSTALQVGTAHGLIIVEDDNDYWLPPPTNCSEFRAVTENAEEVLLDIQLFFFKQATLKVVKPLPPESKTIDQINNGPYGYYSSISAPPNPYGIGKNKPKGFATTADKGRGRNILLVNGGYQPSMNMATGVWQRWRILYSGIKGFFVLTIVDSVTKLPANCEMMLYAKDGVYLNALPRKVGGLFLAAAQRAEILVRCSGPAGAQLTATTRGCKPFSDDCFGYKGDQVPADRINHIGPFEQDTLWTITLTDVPTAPPPDPSLLLPITERRCVPRRPSYAADIRDAALQAAGFDPSNVNSYSVGFGGLNLPGAAPDLLKPAYFYACGYNNGTDLYGKRFEFPDPDPLVLELGGITEFRFNDLDFHPLHVHINPYQIQALNDSWLFSGSYWTPYFEAGDWHDTLTLPMINLAGDVHVPLRFQPGQYSGYTVSHCHFLQHEDVGCMKVVWYRCPTQGANNQTGPCPGFQYPVPGTVPDVLD